MIWQWNVSLLCNSSVEIFVFNTTWSPSYSKLHKHRVPLELIYIDELIYERVLLYLYTFVQILRFIQRTIEPIILIVQFLSGPYEKLKAEYLLYLVLITKAFDFINNFLQCMYWKIFWNGTMVNWTCWKSNSWSLSFNKSEHFFAVT